MKERLTHCLIVFSILTLRVAAQNSAMNSDCTTNPPDFSKLSYEAASDAVNFENDSILSTHEKKICPEYITNLANEIQQGNISDEKRVLGIWLLGSLRPNDTNSVEVLIKYIDLRASRFDPKTRIRRWGDYPAEEALIKIGEPTVNPLLSYLPNEINGLRRHLMCEVLRRVEGKENAQGQIKQRLAAESDLTRQANLKAALKEFEK
jgi:hypothetical protein